MKYIINISQFNEIVNGIKAIKADLVMVNGNTLYGTDNNCMVLKTYNMNINIPCDTFIIITKTLTGEFYNNITDVNVVIDMDINKIYCPNNISYIEDKPEMIDNSNINRIMTMYNNLLYDTTNCLDIVLFNDITDDENFVKIKNMKSSEGADIYYPNNNINYGMYLYNGAIPILKADKIHLTIYNLGNTFISNFIIYKKKSNPVSVYFRFLKV